MSSFMVSAPGKVIVFGEHAVVHGRAAIAAAISLRSYLLVTQEQHPSESISLTFPDIDFSHAWLVEDLPWRSFVRAQGPTDLSESVTQLDESLVSLLDPLLDPMSPNAPEKQKHIHRSAAKAFLYILLSICSGTPPAAHTFTMRSTIPIGAGLGSSASISVCIATAALHLNQLIASPYESNDQAGQTDTDVINHWAYVGEMVIHGTPSGVDNTVATLGHAVHFQRKPNAPSKITPIPSIPPLPLLVINTNQSRNTSAEVAKVRDYLAKQPSIVNHILDAIGGITEAAHTLIGHSSNEHEHKLQLVHELGALSRTNHALLASLGVSHPRLELVRRLVDDPGLGYTKLTGGGGGGCAISLVNDMSGLVPLEKQLTREGMEVRETVLGGHGVGTLAEQEGKRGEGVISVERFLGCDLEAEAERWNWRYW